jgi:hypothetical protein
LFNHRFNNRIGNTAVGDSALFSNTTSQANTATGFTALFNNTTGGSNNAYGVAALFFNTTGSRNIAVGTNALLSNTTGSFNTAIGDMAGGGGYITLRSNGNFNTASGANALAFISTGNNNTATGFAALASNTSGNNNTAHGFSALHNNTTGSFNIALGNFAGNKLTMGSNNIDIGNLGVAGESATIRIGTAGAQTATFVAGISGVAVTGSPVVVNANGRLGVTASSERLKEGIRPMDKASEAILALKPVTFRYKPDLDPDGIPQFGLIAEQVEKVNPNLVTRDADGKVYTVCYEAVNAMLLNEFLKARRQIDAQQKQIDALTAGLQKVSAQLEASKPAPQVVNNP